MKKKTLMTHTLPLLLLGTGGGCHQTLYPTLEQELRKHDPWVREFIENDYTNTKEEGIAHLRLRPKSIQKQNEKQGNLSTPALYKLPEGYLILPQNETHQKDPEIGKLLDHELAHVFFQSLTQESALFQLTQYSGPTQADIQHFCERQIAKPVLNPYREKVQRISAREELDYINKKLNSNLNYYTICRNAKQTINPQIKSTQESLNFKLSKYDIQTHEAQLRNIYPPLK